MSFSSYFDYLKNLPGQVYREQPGRLTKAISLDGKDCFVKLHFGVGWKEIIKNLLQGRLPILGAHAEYQALRALQKIGIPSLEVIQFAKSGWNIAKQKSYLITKALKSTVSLEHWADIERQAHADVRFKRQLIRKLAHIAGTMHAHGINHRDFYLCHFLLDQVVWRQEKKVKLYLIDLHRAQIRAKTPWRWQLKDIAGLYFSALTMPLTRRDLFCFMSHYQKAFDWDKAKWQRFWLASEAKAWRLYEKTYFKKQTTLNVKAIYDPAFASEDLSAFLSNPDAIIAQAKLVKDDATTTVVLAKFGAQACIIKRYNVRDFVKAIKRFFGQSRARRSWLQALRLRHLAIHTPKPIAMLERIRFGFLRESFIVTEYLAGEDLFSLVKTQPEKLPLIATEMQALFRALIQISTAHGDFKASNLWYFQNQIYLLDLDGMGQYTDKPALQRALAKDKKRFLKNWLNDIIVHDILVKYPF